MLARFLGLIVSWLVVRMGFRARHASPPRGDTVLPPAAAVPTPTIRVTEERRAVSRALSYEQGLRLVFAFVALLVLVQFLGWLVVRILDVLVLLFIAIILAISLRPTVERFHRSPIPFTHVRLPRLFWVLMIYVFLLVLLGIGGVLVVPQIIAEGQVLIDNLPQLAASLNDLLENLLGGRTLPVLGPLSNNPEQFLVSFFGYAIGILTFVIGIIGGIFSTFLVLVVAVFLIIGAEDIIRYFVHILPDDRHAQAHALLAAMGNKISGWAIGTLILSAFIGGAATVGLLFIGMPYAFLLGLFAGLCEFIPFVGPWIGAAPALVVAAFQNPWMFIAVAVLYLAIQELEAHVLAPNILGRSVGLPGLVVLLALVAGGSLAGIIGALLAVPVAAILQVLLNDLIIPEIKKAQRKRLE